jgi:hypothetical protein
MHKKILNIISYCEVQIYKSMRYRHTIRLAEIKEAHHSKC